LGLSRRSARDEWMASKTEMSGMRRLLFPRHSGAPHVGAGFKPAPTMA
jgi:hypothetical protein